MDPRHQDPEPLFVEHFRVRESGWFSLGAGSLFLVVRGQRGSHGGGCFSPRSRGDEDVGGEHARGQSPC